MVTTKRASNIIIFSIEIVDLFLPFNFLRNRFNICGKRNIVLYPISFKVEVDVEVVVLFTPTREKRRALHATNEIRDKIPPHSSTLQK